MQIYVRGNVQEECLKGFTNWKYGTDLTHAGAIEKVEVEVVSAGNTDAPPRDARSNGNHARLSCAVAAGPFGLFTYVALVMSPVLALGNWISAVLDKELHNFHLSIF